MKEWCVKENDSECGAVQAAAFSTDSQMKKPQFTVIGKHCGVLL